MSQNPVSRKVKILNMAGLHARPCLAISSAVKKFNAKVQLRRGPDTVDASSILELLTMASPKGTELELRAEGPDAEAVVNELERLFQARFGVDEE